MSKLIAVSDETHEWAKGEAGKHGLTVGRFADLVFDFFRERKVKLQEGFVESGPFDAATEREAAP